MLPEPVIRLLQKRFCMTPKAWLICLPSLAAGAAQAPCCHPDLGDFWQPFAQTRHRTRYTCRLSCSAKALWSKRPAGARRSLARDRAPTRWGCRQPQARSERRQAGQPSFERHAEPLRQQPDDRFGQHGVFMGQPRTNAATRASPSGSRGEFAWRPLGRSRLSRVAVSPFASPAWQRNSQPALKRSKNTTTCKRSQKRARM